jgi:hypothetical protein
MLKKEKVTRKPFHAEAVLVTQENLEEVALWCRGELRTAGTRPYIEVRVYKPRMARQSMAFVDDWVMHTGVGWKVYTPVAFQKWFTILEEGGG